MKNHHLTKQSYENILKKIIESSYDILLGQVGNGRIVIENEASFQLQFSYILKTIGDLYQFSPDDLFSIKLEVPYASKNDLQKSKSKKAKIDIVLSLEDRRKSLSKISCAIELKYFQENNHREPNNRYDVFTDLSNLESYVLSKDYNFGVFILGTDHLHYVNKDHYSHKTSDFDLRHGKKYIAKTELNYNGEKGYPPITLNRDYSFSWNKTNKIYFLKQYIELEC